jgi:hypothetical protein
MIRQQQLELQRLQASNPQNSQAPISAEDSSAVSERSGHGTPIPTASHTSTALPQSGSYSRSPGLRHPRSSFDMARADIQRRSRTPSRGASPRVRAASISAESGDWVLGGRDENAFYQAETQMLTRENQMLRHRIRELEKQLSEPSQGAASSSEPPFPSHLARSTTAQEETKASEEAPRDG